MRMQTDLFLPNILPPLTKYEVNGHPFRLRNLPGADNFPMGNNEGEEDSDRDEQPRHLYHKGTIPWCLRPIEES